MKIIYNNIIPLKGFIAINLFGLIFARKGMTVNRRTLNHEAIHTAQMKEMFYVFFYVWYVVEWIIRIPRYKAKAYENISFEREAYTRMANDSYLKERRPYAWIRYL
jgi:hypothetical protein